MPGFVVNGFGRGAPSSVKPYYKYTWEILHLFGEGVGPNPPAERLPLIYAKDASLPSWGFDKEEVQGSSSTYKFAKSIKWDDIKISWYDTSGLSDKVRAWRRLVWTPEGGLTSPDSYKRTSILRVYTFAWTLPVTWTMYNSWPMTVKTGDLTYTESNVKLVEVTLSYDWAEESGIAN